jgi:hypothetical protein
MIGPGAVAKAGAEVCGLGVATGPEATGDAAPPAVQATLTSATTEAVVANRTRGPILDIVLPFL